MFEFKNRLDQPLEEKEVIKLVRVPIQKTIKGLIGNTLPFFAKLGYQVI